jgi:hypothetical protein
VTQLDVASDHFLSYQDRQVTGDAVRFKMIFLANDEAQKCLEPPDLLHTQLPFAAVRPVLSWRLQVNMD